jgi:hypothetical protein
MTPRQRLAALWAAGTPLERLVALHRGNRLFKWQHYYAIYDHHFRGLRRRPVTLLEIGIAQGGSLQLWRRYFGRRSRIVGVDVRPECRRFASGRIQVEIGDQGDPEFLADVARRHGPFDIVIDDGSHHFHHQLTTFRALFPHLKQDGIYACEDLCSSYWEEEFDGGLRNAATYVEFLKQLVDELNHWFWRDEARSSREASAAGIHALHFYTALVVIAKRDERPPVVLHVGREI